MDGNSTNSPGLRAFHRSSYVLRAPLKRPEPDSDHRGNDSDAGRSRTRGVVSKYNPRSRRSCRALLGEVGTRTHSTPVDRSRRRSGHWDHTFPTLGSLVRNVRAGPRRPRGKVEGFTPQS